MNLKMGDLSCNKLDQCSETEQINQIVKAILEGKYSWACVLILRFYGYNPLHYIPYRTYQRLLKQHRYSSNEYQGSEAFIEAVDEDTEVHLPIKVVSPNPVKCS